jgi:hypothetical protein
MMRRLLLVIRPALIACYALLGALLLALNLAGLLIPLRNDAIYTDATNGFAADITLTYDQFRAESPRRAGEPDAAYIARLTDLVHRGMAHRWPDDGSDTYRLRVPAWENYLLHLASYARPEIYRRYEFADPDRAMARGVGLCSQHALALAALLRRAGIAAQVVELDGHVVTRAVAADGNRYLADADFGLVLPHGRRAIEADPEIAAPYYEAAVTDWQGGVPEGYPTLVAGVVAFYGPEGNDTLPETWSPAGTPAFEVWAYRLKWPLPVVLLALAALCLLPRHRDSPYAPTMP